MVFDLDRVRLETPACADLIHLDNAGCSLMPESVYATMTGFQELEQSIGGYRAGVQNGEGLEGFYDSAAQLVGGKPDEIAFVESATRGWQQFFYSLDLTQGGRIITSRVDYGSSFVAYIQAARKWGVEIDIVETDDNGDIRLENLEVLIRDNTRLISAAHIPTGNGIINDAAGIGAIARQAGVPFLLDACQSVGQLDLDVDEIGCTALSGSFRKYLRGPRGTGFLYVSRDYYENNEPMFIEQQGANLRDDSNYELVDSARRYENFEYNLAGKLGATAAMQYAIGLGLDCIEERILRLAESCRRKLDSIPGVTVRDRGTRRCGIVTFTVDGVDPAETRAQLWEQEINTWVSTGPGSLVDFQARGLTAVSRASVHYFNTEAEIDTFCGAIEKIARS